MGLMTWSKNPIAVAQEYNARHGPTALEPLFVWATWTVEGLYYLGDIDDVQASYPDSVGVHHPDIVDIAHARWATGTAVTALDLCAAGLGRRYCSWTKANEMDLRYFDPAAKKKVAATMRSKLPPMALAWVDSVVSDPRYRNIQSARNPFTHSWMNRQLQRHMGGPGNGHGTRTAFRITVTGALIGARDLVQQSRDLAGERVDGFLQVIDAL